MTDEPKDGHELTVAMMRAFLMASRRRAITEANEIAAMLKLEQVKTESQVRKALEAKRRGAHDDE